MSKHLFELYKNDYCIFLIEIIMNKKNFYLIFYNILLIKIGGLISNKVCCLKNKTRLVINMANRVLKYN